MGEHLLVQHDGWILSESMHFIQVKSELFLELKLRTKANL